MILAVVLFVVAITLAIWSLVASHTSDRRTGLEPRRDLYTQTCLEHGHDPLADHDLKGTP